MDLENIDRRLERIEDKLDTHLQRVTSIEESLTTVQGHIKVIATLGLAVISAFLTALFRSIGFKS